MKRCFIFALLVLPALAQMPPPPIITGHVMLAWNPSTDSTVTGYNIYYGGKSGTYTNRLAGIRTTNKLVTGLVKGVPYYFTATTQNASRVQSPFSNEVTFTIPTNVPAPVVGPVVLLLSCVISNPPFPVMFFRLDTSTDLVHWTAANSNFPPLAIKRQ